MKTRLSSTIGFALALAFAASVATAQTPKLGQPAPPIKGAEWFKGAPFEKFEPGKVYVLEFWATWCGYCIQAMPHLSELSEKYKGKVEFVGVDVLEHPPKGADREEWTSKTVGHAITTGVAKAMTYRTCRDTVEKYMEKTWMPASAQVDYPTGGIPLTFIIDQKGCVAWIGHPFSPAGVFDQALEKIVAGTYHVADLIAAVQAKRDNLKQQADDRATTLAPLLKPMRDALAAKDYPRVIAEALNAVALDGRASRETFQPRLQAFRALTVSDPKTALTLFELEKERAPKKDGPMDLQLTDLASVFATEPGLPREAYDFAIEALESHDPAGKVLHYRFARALASAYFNSGQIAKAVEFQQKFIARHRQIADDREPTEEIATLKKFQAALKP